MMGLLPARRRSNPQYSVILGLCPGCYDWQLDYHDDVAAELGEQAFFDAIDEALGDHLDECPDLQLLLDGT